MHLNSELYDGVETVEFLISDTRQKYFFPELPKLRNKLIRRIELSGSMHTTPLNYVISAEIADARITLVTKGTEIIKEYPLGYLNMDYSLYNRNTEFFNHIFDLGKSYIFVPDPSTLVIGQGFIVTFYYQDAEKVKFTKELPALKAEYIEAPVLNLTDNIIRFNNFRNIQDKKICYLSVFNTGGGTYTTPDGRTIVTLSNVLGSYVNLWSQDKEKVKDLPLGRLLNAYPRRELILFRPAKFDWENSFIRIANPAYLTVGQVFYLPVFYLD
ncbi:MAG: hypothetical protein JXQ80_12255 [Bacteroidales bacterium]|nr:hypothetical protein [Bacteroidales bacterium]